MKTFLFALSIFIAVEIPFLFAEESFQCPYEITEIFHCAEKKDGIIQIAPQQKKGSGKYSIRLVLDGKLKSGRLELRSFNVYNPRDFSMRITKDDEKPVPMKIALPENGGKQSLELEFPQSVQNATVLTIDITGRNTGRNYPAASFVEPRFFLKTEKASGENVDEIRFCKVHPWMEKDVKASILAPEIKAEKVVLSGPRNDWMTGAVMLKTNGKTGVGIQLESPKELNGRISLRVVGQVYADKSKNPVWDPVMYSWQAQRYGGRCLNAENIRFFPSLYVTSRCPAFLWITVDARNVKSGRYEAKIRIAQPGKMVDFPLTIKVGQAELPLVNPLKLFTWQSNSRDPRCIQDMLEHGINVFWMEHGAA